MLNWAQRFNIFCFLDNQDYSIEPHEYDCLLAVGANRIYNASSSAFSELDSFTRQQWSFGHISYNLGQQWFGIPANSTDPTGFSSFSFFQPQYFISIKGETLTIEGEQTDIVFQDIQSQSIVPSVSFSIAFQANYTKQEYIDTIKRLQQHIQQGDCYEINFCQEFFSAKAIIDPIQVFHKLMEVSPNPFSALYKVKSSYLLCASPERFLCKRGSKLISQPIKGTHKRIPDDPVLDNVAKEALLNSAKDQSENVMVVDLVRNDLSKVCKPGTVQVNELFGIYTFPQVFQMISTVAGEIAQNTTFTDIIKATFPMGSMTGAPKKKVMELIHHYEKSARGIFSGAVGYITPGGDFDFNVVIRSLMYNSDTNYLSYQVGSGITIYSDPEQEWEECLLKAAAIKKVLTK
jgi:para-aminobenzoate synthetase component 1